MHKSLQSTVSRHQYRLTRNTISLRLFGKKHKDLSPRELQEYQTLATQVRQVMKYADAVHGTLTTRRTATTKARLLQALAWPARCVKCGYDACLSALDFHHMDPAQKDANVMTLPFEDALVEARKCQLLCACCHREVHHAHRVELLRHAVVTSVTPSSRLDQCLQLARVPTDIRELVMTQTPVVTRTVPLRVEDHELYHVPQSVLDRQQQLRAHMTHTKANDARNTVSRPPSSPWIRHTARSDTHTFQITRSWLESTKPTRGNWTKPQIEALGLSYPLPHQWRTRIVGTWITPAAKDAVEARLHTHLHTPDAHGGRRR